MLKQDCFTDWLSLRLEEELPFIQYLIEDWPKESNQLINYLDFADERLNCKGSDTWDIICFLWATYAYESLEKCGGQEGDFQDALVEARYQCLEALKYLDLDRHELKLNLLEYLDIMDEELKFIQGNS